MHNTLQLLDNVQKPTELPAEFVSVIILLILLVVLIILINKK